jgi:Family of unknown function (DUF6529)
MEDFVEDLANGQLTEVKIVLTSVIAALAVYQVALMAVGWGKVRLPFLHARAASASHRAVGDTIVPITLLVSIMCLAYFGIEDGIEHARPGQETVVVIHVASGFLLGAVLALKIAIVRWWHGLSRFLPVLGLSVLGLFVVAWVTSAGAYL